MSITITDRAIERLKTIAEGEGIDTESAALRLAVKQGGCSGLTYDLGWDTTILESDQIEMIAGIKVVVDSRSEVYVEGTELDFTDGLDGQGFHFLNPQASRTCACGESFGL